MRDPDFVVGKTVRPRTMLMIIAAMAVLALVVLVGGWFAFQLLISLMIG